MSTAGSSIRRAPVSNTIPTPARSRKRKRSPVPAAIVGGSTTTTFATTEITPRSRVTGYSLVSLTTFLSSPQRWDVFVFKYPLGARMNYIKRLIGLPGETVLIREGDIFVTSDGKPDWEIARKPPHKIQAMKQLVHNTEHQPADLVSKGWPSLWQPLKSADGQTSSSWAVEHSQTGLVGESAGHVFTSVVALLSQVCGSGDLGID